MRFLTLMLILAGCPHGYPLEERPCTSLASEALERCIVDVSTRHGECYRTNGQSCPADDPALVAALDAVEPYCVDGELAGLGEAAVEERLRSACASEAAGLAWRAWGGPHGVAAESADCVGPVHDIGVELLADSMSVLRSCIKNDCAQPGLASSRANLAARAEESIAAACPDLPSRIAVDAATFAERAAQQADCATATAFGEVDIPLSCGPSNADIGEILRGEWTEVVVDGDKWGTQCGDGSEYAFWIRPAAEGAPLDNVVVTLQGGGVCLFDVDCAAVTALVPGLLRARDIEDYPFPVGIASADPTVSPFTDWTMLYLPYCNQDVFAGGGVVEDLGGGLQIPRYGAINLRAAVQMTRDWLWRELDAEGGDGYRPDNVTALFGGFSAGSYGTLYNYHWFLDDLLWPNTVAFPDGGLAVDNGELLGVGSLGALKIPAWGMQNLLPAYCFEGPCSGGEVLVNALSPRLQRPEQNILMLSNQLDSTQAGDAFFADDASFINALRQMYCDTRDLGGVHWFLGSESSTSVHVISTRDDMMTREVAGSTLAAFLERAVTDPMSLQSHVEEADFVDAVPGVLPIPCEP